MLHRQRAGKYPFRISLKNSQAPPPPRRSNTTLTPLRGTITTSSTSKQDLGATSEHSDASSSLGIMYAISQMNQSTALLAAKAFLIATGLVAFGGVTFTWGVKTTLGVEDAREFGQKMRSVLQTTLPGLRSRLYRPPETEIDDERYEIETRGVAIDQEWKWEEANERLKKAYKEGGIGVWAQTALTELEAETRMQRKREQEVASASDKEEPSLN